MTTLDECVTILARTNNFVELYALSVKNNKPQGTLLNSVKRNLPMLAFKLKGQFGMISDLVTAVYAGSGRGASEVMRVRGLREGMAQIKVQLDIAITQTIAKHDKSDEIKAEKAAKAAAKEASKKAAE